jgi:hypothetical protein
LIVRDHRDKNEISGPEGALDERHITLCDDVSIYEILDMSYWEAS